MKTTRLILTAMLFVFSLTFTACGASSPEAPAAEAQTPIPAQEATANIIPEPTKAPPPVCMLTFDTDRDGNREVYLMDPDGKDPVNLSNNPAEDRNPVWSPDGTRIAFVSNRDNGQEGGQFIYVIHADGSHLRQLTTNSRSDFPDWAHDGSRIAYISDAAGNRDVYVIPADGSGQAVNLTNSLEEDNLPAWSPDGSRIAWLSGSDQSWNLFVMNADGSGVRQLTEDGKVRSVEWTVDGQLFTDWDSLEHGCCHFVMNTDGTGITQHVGKGEIQRYLPFWTLDGNRVECQGGDLNGGDSEIYLVGEIYPDIFFNLTNNPADDRNPDWPAECGPGEAPSAVETQPAAEVQPKDPHDLVFGYAGDDQWQQQRKANFQKACDELGLQCVYGGMPELIAQGVDAIVQNSNNIIVNGLHPDILSARDKGIPVFVLDADTSTDGAYSISIDHQQWAAAGLEWMFEKIGGQGQFAYFDLQPQNRHADILEKMLAKYPGISVVEKRDGKYDRGQLEPDVVNLVMTYPDLKAIWTSENLVAAQWAVKGGKPGTWPLVLCEANKEGLFAWTEMLKVNPDFECIALVNPPGIAYDAVYAAYFLVTGSQIDESVLGGEYGNRLPVNIPVVTKDNLQEWLEQVADKDGKYPLDELMTPEEIKESWFIQ